MNNGIDSSLFGKEIAILILVGPHLVELIVKEIENLNSLLLIQLRRSSVLKNFQLFRSL